MRRVVVTGMGLISPVGNTLDEAADALRQGRSGIRAMSDWAQYGGLHSLVAGPAQLPEIKLIPRANRRTMGRVALLAAFAVRNAVAQAKLPTPLAEPGRVGVAFGSTTGSGPALEEFFDTFLRTRGFTTLEGTLFPKIMSHTVAANLAAWLGARGRLLATCSACASSLQAIGAGFEAIAAGSADVMICGGADDLHPSTPAVFDVLLAASRAYNAEPHRTPRPFDRDRDGLVISEGAGAVVLEEYEHAQRRGATALGEVVGYATNCSGAHMTQLDEQGVFDCMSMALDSARMRARELDYIHAHATGTLQGDAAEAAALRRLVGDAVPCSSSKGYTGHTLAASGAVGLIFSLLMMQEGFLARGQNLDHVDPACGGLRHVLEAVEAAPRRMLCSSFAFGGVGASVVIGRP